MAALEKAAVTGVEKSFGREMLGKAGGKVVEELVGLAFNAALAEFGGLGALGGGNDNSAQFQAINAKLDKISKQVASLNSDLVNLSLDSRLDTLLEPATNISSLFEQVLNTMKGYADRKNTGTSESDIQSLRQLIMFQNPTAMGKRIFKIMCGDTTTDPLLKQEWLAILRDEKRAIPDPMDAYTAIKKFSLKYQKELIHAAYLWKFFVHTWWADRSAPVETKTAQQLENHPMMAEVRKLNEMVNEWDKIFEKGDNTIVDKLIVRMSEAFLGEHQQGLQLFWYRSDGWCLGLYQPIRTIFLLMRDLNEYMVYLSRRRDMDKNNWSIAPFMFYNAKDKTYYIRFERENREAGWRDIGPECLVNDEYNILNPLYYNRMERYRLEYNTHYTTAQPLKLQIIKKPVDKDMPQSNIWFHIHLAGPAPTTTFFTQGTSSKGVPKNSTEYLMRYKLQATAEDNHDLRFNDDCDGQYDTEFAFGLAE